MEAARPVSHSDVVKAFKDRGYDRATLFRNLKDLTEAGLLIRKDYGDHIWKFESPGVEASSDEGHHHPHFICVACHDTLCLEELDLPKSPSEVYASKIGSIQDVVVRGVCSNCDE
jgi:Fur family ferric uptake transcriptional regulator